MALLSLYSSTSELLTIAPLGFVVWYLVYAVYSWYRLRHIPGPFYASFSDLWLVRMALSNKQLDSNWDLEEKYGSLVRIGPNFLHTSDPDLIRRMSSSKINYRKSDWYQGNRFNPYKSIMFVEPNPHIHDQLKTKLTPGYNGKDIEGVESDVDIQVMNMVQLIKSKYLTLPGENSARFMDLGRVVSYFTFDVISRLALGKEAGCLENDTDTSGFIDGIEEFLPTLSKITNIWICRKMMLSKLGLILLGPKETDTKGMGKLMGMTNAGVRKAYSPEGAKKKNMLGSFARHGLSQSECESEALFMFIAGSDTTAAAIRNTLMHIITTPLVYQRLKEEIAAAIRDGKVSRPITLAQARSLPYLKAVIFEGLRTRPVTTSILAKDVPPGGDTFKGQFLPEGTSIGMNIPSVLRSKAIFGEDANIFRPERFLEVDEETQAELQRNVEFVFGNGRWMCSGRPIAFMELHKVYFELLREFDFQIVNPRNPMKTDNWTQFVDRQFFVRVTKSTIAS
ncbi:cytochrome P450 [Biscogniauxia mediterranea]|nr:cytochrome P450 [Biscogniauxia mediterranea]